jgi:2-aminoethylphosphonate transport system permease protein
VTLFAGVFLLPLAVILLSSLSKQWNGLLPPALPLPTLLTRFAGGVGFAVFQPDGGLAPAWLLLCDVGGAGAAPDGAKLQKYLGLMFYLPSAIPSVSVGRILVAFSQGRCR